MVDATFSSYETGPNASGPVTDETPVQVAPQTANVTTANAGATQAGQANQQDNKQNAYGIGKRLINPLSLYSSYTYQISLYIITPDAWEEFNSSGRKNLKVFNNTTTNEGGTGGAYLIAQSGGVNDDSRRAPGFEFDYYIDNMEITGAAAGEDAGGNGTTVNSNITFNIVEPYGFSFISNLKRAFSAIKTYSNTVNYSERSNPTRDFFIIGIRFLGYDADGNLITRSPLINEPDPTFQRYYDVKLKNLNFKIDGRSVVYRIEAAAAAIDFAAGVSHGMIDRGANNLNGTRVGDICRQLTEKLNADQKRGVDNKSREFANTYEIKFIGEASAIEQSSVVNTADLNKIKWPMALTKDKETVNTNLEIRAQPNSKERMIAFNRETPIIQAISSIIVSSDYLLNGLQSVYENAEGPNPKTSEPDEVPIDSAKRLKWFSIVPSVKQVKFDTKLKDWACHITYNVQTYEIPHLKSAYADKTTPYYGPAKRYEYWYTGQNSEVLRFEQQLNNAYFTSAVSAENATDKTTAGPAEVPVRPDKRTYGDRLGQIGIGREAQNSIPTELVDGAWASTTIEILGDPDFLHNPTPTGTEREKSFNGPDGFTINPSAGQVFIEIKFLEPVDYNHQKGYIEINKNILFWDYPAKIAEQTDGAIVFQLRTVKSKFQSGRFTQTLMCDLYTFSEVEGPKQSEVEAKQREERQNQSDAETKRLQRQSTGLTNSTPVGAGTSPGSRVPGSTNTSDTQVTNSNGVAEDDAAAGGPSTYSPGIVDGSFQDGGRGGP